MLFDIYPSLGSNLLFKFEYVDIKIWPFLSLTSYEYSAIVFAVNMMIVSLWIPWVHFYIYLFHWSHPASLEQTISVYFLILQHIEMPNNVLPAPHGNTIYPLLAIRDPSFSLVETTDLRAYAW